jgi:8-oxo-dGTP pyrophosphatase MutT (NUDIX family)
MPKRKSSRQPFKVLCAGCVPYRRVGTDVEVLVAQRPDGSWTFPRGKLADGELARTTAVREALEETGVNVRLGVEIGGYSYPIGRARFKHVVFFAATAVSGEPRPDGREFVDVAWLPAEEARACLDTRDAVLVSTVELLLEDRVLR